MGKNLNDTFPGSADGTVTEKLCHVLVNEIAAKKQISISICTVVTALSIFIRMRFTTFTPSDPQNTAASPREMAQVYGLDFVSFTETSGAGATDQGNFYAAVSELGIPSIQPEIGGIGLILEETKMLHYTGARNILANKGMVGYEVKKNEKQQELSRFYRLKSEFNGIYHCFVSPGQYVKKGEPLAKITDHHGEETYVEFFAEESAVILWVMSSFAVKVGENLMAIGVI